jgi:serine-type D-Ala-D-Ala carboxypeptidase/endopeptidase (penicillin-binding protein 4)
MNRTIAVLALALAPALAAAATLAPEVQQALQRERIPLDAVTVLVQEAGSGTTRASHNAQQPMNPASVAKLLTTYAALDELGPAYTWKTPVWLAGPIKNGVLEGHVHLQGRGDPKLTLERVWLALQRIRAMGVNEIRGDIVVDQSAFVVPEVSTAEFDNEPLRPYNARSQALLLNLSAVIYTFTPDAARGVALVSAEPLLDGACRSRPRCPWQAAPAAIGAVASRRSWATRCECALPAATRCRAASASGRWRTPTPGNTRRVC